VKPDAAAAKKRAHYLVLIRQDARLRSPLTVVKGALNKHTIVTGLETWPRRDLLVLAAAVGWLVGAGVLRRSDREEVGKEGSRVRRRRRRW